MLALIRKGRDIQIHIRRGKESKAFSVAGVVEVEEIYKVIEEAISIYGLKKAAKQLESMEQREGFDLV